MAAGAPCGQWEWRFVLTDSLPTCENGPHMRTATMRAVANAHYDRAMIALHKRARAGRREYGVCSATPILIPCGRAPIFNF
jgi:hypothetical protein